MIISLNSLLLHLSPIALAFSGGLDSRFLAHMARRANAVAHLFHITGPHVPSKETHTALAWAARQELPVTVLKMNPLDIPEIAANTPMRCYHCKYFLFSTLKEHLESTQKGSAFTLCDGTNASDLGMHRPGLQALHELRIRSPLAECELSKDDIRTIGTATGLDNPLQKARPCLLTRLPYGIAHTAKLLVALDAAESAIAAFFASESVMLRGTTQRASSDNPLAPAPDFRLRPLNAQGPPYCAELHLTAPLSPALGDGLARVIMQCGFSRPEIRVLSTICGYHDKITNTPG